MSSAPPPYPRMPHLVSGRGSSDDTVVSVIARSALFGSEIVVEEKVDGANVVIWRSEGDRMTCSLRSGRDAMDRASQLGPLKAWAARHDGPLTTVLHTWPALYAEWLLVTHSVAYDRLFSYLVVLDLWHPEHGFALVDDRNVACREAGLVTPPELWRGRAASVAAIEGLLGPSELGSAPMEGLVVRRVDGGEPRVAKLVAAGFDQATDEAWRARRPRNRLVAGEASWH